VKCPVLRLRNIGEEIIGRNTFIGEKREGVGKTKEIKDVRFR